MSPALFISVGVFLLTVAAYPAVLAMSHPLLPGADPLRDIPVEYWLTLTMLKGVHSFLGAIGFYRHFIENYASVVKPLIDLTKKDTPFVWSPQCQATFIHLKNLMTMSLILVHPDSECLLVLEINEFPDTPQVALPGA